MNKPPWILYWYRTCPIRDVQTVASSQRYFLTWRTRRLSWVPLSWPQKRSYNSTESWRLFRLQRHLSGKYNISFLLFLTKGLVSKETGVLYAGERNTRHGCWLVALLISGCYWAYTFDSSNRNSSSLSREQSARFASDVSCFKHPSLLWLSNSASSKPEPASKLVSSVLSSKELFKTFCRSKCRCISSMTQNSTATIIAETVFLRSHLMNFVNSASSEKVKKKPWT